MGWGTKTIIQTAELRKKGASREPCKRREGYAFGTRFGYLEIEGRQSKSVRESAITGTATLEKSVSGAVLPKGMAPPTEAYFSGGRILRPPACDLMPT
jgi:hypothetical protein